MSRPSVEVRRALTDIELATVAARIAEAGSLSELVDSAIVGLYDTLLTDTDHRFADFDTDNPIHPTRFAIPAVQWQALAHAVTARADQWGAATTIALTLTDIWPSSYDDAAVPEPNLAVADRRPDRYTIQVTRAAADEIAECETHLSSLARHYGPTSEQYLDALHSWHQLLVGFFATRRGTHTHVDRDGRLSLLITCDSLTYAVIFHGRPRECTDPACAATASDTATWQPPHNAATLPGHVHAPSYPFGAPQPGRWSFHS